MFARFGEKEKMLTVIYQFKKGVPSRVRTYGVERSELFDVSPMLRQIRVLLPCVFKVLLFAAIYPVRVRLSAHNYA